jgi:hypothetical protein
MKRIATILSVLILIAAFTCSCKPESANRKKPVPSFSTHRTGSDLNTKASGKNEIFYGLLTPTEITTIFSRLGAPYEKAALNPTANSGLYSSNAKAAMNLGIYGVDFGYIKMFGLGQMMIDYIMTIKDMSYKLGIPDKYLMNPIKKLENDMSSPDTIMVLVNKSYNDIETHLRKEGRESTAGLMLMGGWVEAMFLTTQLLYTPEINKSRQIILASGSETTATLETLTSIRDYVAKLRTEMVNP